MRKLLYAVLPFMLTGCAAIAPIIPAATATEAPTSTPQIVLQTVVVTVLVTVPPTDTPIPTATWTPIPTLTPQPTSQTGTPSTSLASGTAQASTTAAVTSPSATLPADAGGGLFTDLTRSTDHFAIRCQPDTLTLGLATTNTRITEVDLFYRLEDQLGSTITSWVDIGKMTGDSTGNFTYDFKSSFIPSDVRMKQAWFDYQFVGLTSQGQIVGRSARILKQVTVTLDCPS